MIFLALLTTLSFSKEITSGFRLTNNGQSVSWESTNIEISVTPRSIVGLTNYVSYIEINNKHLLTKTATISTNFYEDTTNLQYYIWANKTHNYWVAVDNTCIPDKGSISHCSNKCKLLLNGSATCDPNIVYKNTTQETWLTTTTTISLPSGKTRLKITWEKELSNKYFQNRKFTETQKYDFFLETDTEKITVDPWYDSEFRYCRDLNLTNNIQKNTSYEPVFFWLNDTDTATDGSDVRIIDHPCLQTGGTEIPYQIVKGNTTSGVLRILMLINRSSEQNYTYAVYYGNPNAAAPDYGTNDLSVIDIDANNKWINNTCYSQKFETTSGTPNDFFYLTSTNPTSDMENNHVDAGFGQIRGRDGLTSTYVVYEASEDTATCDVHQGPLAVVANCTTTKGPNNVVYELTRYTYANQPSGACIWDNEVNIPNGLSGEYGWQWTDGVDDNWNDYYDYDTESADTIMTTSQGNIISVTTVVSQGSWGLRSTTIDLGAVDAYHIMLWDRDATDASGTYGYYSGYFYTNHYVSSDGSYGGRPKLKDNMTIRYMFKGGNDIEMDENYTIFKNPINVSLGSEENLLEWGSEQYAPELYELQNDTLSINIVPKDEDLITHVMCYYNGTAYNTTPSYTRTVVDTMDNSAGSWNSIVGNSDQNSYKQRYTGTGALNITVNGTHLHEISYCGQTDKTGFGQDWTGNDHLGMKVYIECNGSQENKRFKISVKDTGTGGSAYLIYSTYSENVSVDTWHTHTFSLTGAGDIDDIDDIYLTMCKPDIDSGQFCNYYIDDIHAFNSTTNYTYETRLAAPFVDQGNTPNQTKELYWNFNVLDQPLKNWTFPGSYTYNTSLINASGNNAILQYLPNNITFKASFDTSLNASYSRDSGSLIATVPLNPTVDNNVYKYGGGSMNSTGVGRGGVNYNATNNADTALQRGTIGYWYRPAYSGTPATYQYLMNQNTGASGTNRLFTFHGTDGNLMTYIYGNSGVILIISSAWSPTAETWYYFEFNYDITNGASRLFIDGTQQGSTDSSTGTRDDVDTIGLCHNYYDGTACDGSIDDFTIYDDVQHTTTFTPPTHATRIYPNTTPNITTNDPLNTTGITGLLKFQTTSTEPNNTSLTYVLSTNNTTWSYYNTTQTQWLTSTGAEQSNNETTINSSINSFNFNETLYWGAYLTSDGKFTPTLTEVNITYTELGNWTENTTTLTQTVKRSHHISDISLSTSTLFEGQTLNLNVTITKHLDSSTTKNMIINFNNTNYSTTLLLENSTTIIYNTTLSMPALTEADGANITKNITAWFNTSYNPSRLDDNTTNVTIYEYGFSNCSEGGFVFLNATTRDEQTLSLVTSNMTVVIRFDTLTGEFTKSATSKNNTSHLFCLTPNYTTITGATVDIDYEAPNYRQRDYFFCDLSINNTTNYSATMYLLQESEGTVIQFSVINVTTPVQDVTIDILRWYSELGVSGEWTTISMEKTDYGGVAVADLELYDPWYSFRLFKNCRLLQDYNKTKVTQTNMPPFTLDITDPFYNYNPHITYSCGNDSTNIFCEISNSQGWAITPRLEVYNVIITATDFMTLNCTETGTPSPSSTIICAIGNMSGKQFYYKLYANIGGTNQLITSGTINGGTTNPWGTMGVYLEFMVSLTMIMISLSNPVLALLLYIFTKFIFIIMGITHTGAETTTFITAFLLVAITIKKVRT